MLYLRHHLLNDCNSHSYLSMKKVEIEPIILELSRGRLEGGENE